MDLEASVALLKPIGWGAVGLLVATWLIVSLTSPSRVRAVLEWLGAVSIYVALLCLFSSLAWSAWSGGNYFAVAAFGLLQLIFLSGLGVSLVSLARELSSGSGSARVDATH